MQDAKPTKHTQPFPRGRGLGLGLENLLYFLKTDVFYKLRRGIILFNIKIKNSVYKKGTKDMAEFKYEITQELGVISEGKYNIELNMVSWNDREPKYDIRSWAPDHSRMGKGISLTEEEMERLVELWNTRNEEDSFEE